jgi:hypothetical protein
MYQGYLPYKTICPQNFITFEHTTYFMSWAKMWKLLIHAFPNNFGDHPSPTEHSVLIHTFLFFKTTLNHTCTHYKRPVDLGYNLFPLLFAKMTRRVIFWMGFTYVPLITSTKSCSLRWYSHSGQMPTQNLGSNKWEPTYTHMYTNP